MFLINAYVKRNVFFFAETMFRIQRNSLTICTIEWCNTFNLLFYLLLLKDRFFLCRPGGIHAVVQAGLQLRDWPASASRALGLKVHTGQVLFKGSFCS